MNNAQRTALIEWVQLHRACAICWWPESDGRRHLQVHHLVSGQNRSKAHHPKCYLRLCDRCHDVLHDGKVAGNFPDLTAAHMLQAKRESDPDNYDPEYLAQLKAKKHLGYDPEPIPDWYLQERERNLCRSRKP